MYHGSKSSLHYFMFVYFFVYFVVVVVVVVVVIFDVFTGKCRHMALI